MKNEQAPTRDPFAKGVDKSELRALTTVTVPTICIIRDETGNSLDTAIMFIEAGDNTYDATQIASKGYGGISNAYVHCSIELPADFDKNNVPYWNYPYIG